MFEVLKQDHRDIKNQIQALLENNIHGGELSYHKLQTVCGLLQTHMRIEEKFLYPKAEKEREAQQLIRDSYEEHNEVKELIREIEADPKADHVITVLKSILKDLEHHIREEEEQLFPLLERRWSPSDIEAISQDMKTLKEKEPIR